MARVFRVVATGVVEDGLKVAEENCELFLGVTLAMTDLFIIGVFFFHVL